MASIETGSGHGGKKSVDQEIPLIPFIDLLFCCVMFLLMTAVWNRLGSIEANQRVPGPNSEDAVQDDTDHVRLMLQIEADRFRLASSAGDFIEIPNQGGDYDMVGLAQRLEERKRLEPARLDIIVAPEDGVRYEHVLGAMDLVVGAGFPEMSLSDGAALM